MATRAPQTEIYTLRLQDGSEVDVEGPPGASEDQLYSFLQQSGQDNALQPQQAPSGQDQQKVLANSYQQHGYTPTDPNQKLAPDEEIVFGDQQGPKTGFRYTPEQEQEITSAIAAGDVGQAVALANRYSDGTATITRDTVQKFVDWHRQNPGAPIPSISYGATDAAAQDAYNTERYRGYDKLTPEEMRSRDVLPESADAFARGAVPFGLDDEVDAAVSTALYGGTFEDNLARARAIQDYDERNNPGTRIAGAVAGSLALPTRLGGGGMVSIGRSAAQTAYLDARAAGLGMTEARNLAQAAARRAIGGQFAREGAIYGGATGAGSGDDISERVTGGLGGATVGGALGAITPTVGRVLQQSHAANLAPVAAREIPEGQRVLQAAERQGINVLPADVGGTATKRLTAGTLQTPFGAGSIEAARNASTDSMMSARDRISAAVGNALDPEASGQSIREGAMKQLRADKTAAGAAFRAAEKAADGALVEPKKAVESLNRNIYELSKIPGGSDALKLLTSIRDDLLKRDGEHAVEAISATRKTLRDQFMQNGLIGSDVERRAMQAVDALQEDVRDSLMAQGKEGAANLYARANQQWRALKQKENDVLIPLLGNRDNPRSGEQVTKSLMADLQGNNARALKLLSSLPPEEQSNLRASIIGGLGRTGPNSDEFSVDVFLTNWGDKKFGKSAKNAFFGPETRAALDDLAAVAQARKNAQGYLNRSNTGGSIEANRLFTYLTAIPTLGFSVASQYGMGKLLASPRFARWLAKAPKTSLSDEAYIDRLSRIARAEPAIANDLLDLQQRLRDGLSAGGGARLAANEGVNAAPRIEVQQSNQNQEAQQ